MYHCVLIQALLDLLVHPVLLVRQHVHIGFHFSVLSEPIYEAILAAQAAASLLQVKLLRK